MAELTGGKIKAATLIEVLVAMVILLVVFAIAMMVFKNINTSYSPKHDLLAYLKLEETVQQTKDDLSFIDEEFETENMRIIKKVYDYTQGENLFVLEIVVMDKTGRILNERKEILRKDENSLR